MFENKLKEILPKNSNEWYRKKILQAFREEIEQAMPEKKDHVCRFNDGDQKCDCYYEALDKVKSNLLNRLGEEAQEK